MNPCRERSSSQEIPSSGQSFDKKKSKCGQWTTVSFWVISSCLIIWRNSNWMQTVVEWSGLRWAEFFMRTTEQTTARRTEEVQLGRRNLHKSQIGYQTNISQHQQSCTALTGTGNCHIVLLVSRPEKNSFYWRQIDQNKKQGWLTISQTIYQHLYAGTGEH